MKKLFWITVPVVLCTAVFLYWQTHRTVPLRDTDYLLLGEITNRSGEPAFDGSLHEALRIALDQSPHLNLISDEKIRTALRKMQAPETQPLTPDLAKQICSDLDAAAYLTGQIERHNGDYTVQLTVNQCKDPSRAASAEAKAAQPELLIHQLGLAASAIRRQLGEDSSSLQNFNVPLELAATPSPTALKAYSDARRALLDKGDLAAVPLYRQAIDADSRFAVARSGLAVSYYNLNQLAEASESIRQAYEAGDRQTAREHLNISTLYYDMAQGDVEKAIAGYKEYIRIYPRDDTATGNLSSEYFVIGDYEAAAKYSAAALKLAPDAAAWYENYSTALLSMDRNDEAESSLKEAFSRKLDDASLHDNLYSLAFVRKDQALMQAQLQWAEGKAGGDSIFAAQADTDAYFGHAKKSEQLTQKAIDMASTSDLPEAAATYAAEAAMRDAVLGYSKLARDHTHDALRLTPTSKDVRALAALIYARLGEEQDARKIADDLRALYPSNVAIQKAWLPMVYAQLAMNKHHYDEAIQRLQIVAPYERGQLTGNVSNSCMIPVFLRGESFLALSKSQEALAEFRKLEGSPGLVGNCWSGPLAKLGMARAHAQAGGVTQAKLWYDQLLFLWAQADSDLPLLKQIKLERSKLH
jgi:eukaryotic-like serine/threonine-protein kinase